MIAVVQKENQVFFSTGVKFRTIFQVLMGSVLLAFCSQIKFSLAFTPVPITFQTLAVLLIGATMGSHKGAWAIACYFAEILIGLPVLSGGTSDPIVFIGPKGGYVLGFLLQAFIMGWLVENFRRVPTLSIFLGALCGTLAQMALGISFLAQFVGWDQVWTMGLFPFIPGEIFKIAVISLGLKTIKTNYS